jgi:hypothetical protein
MKTPYYISGLHHKLVNANVFLTAMLSAILATTTVGMSILYSASLISNEHVNVK